VIGRKTFARWLAALALALAAAPGWASVYYISTPSYNSVEYSPATGFSVALTISVGHGLGSAEPFFVTFGGGLNGTVGARLQSIASGSTCPYWLYADAGGSAVLSDLANGAQADQVLSGTLAADVNTLSLTFYYVIPAELYPPMGFYSDTVSISLYDGTLAAHSDTPNNSQNIQFLATVNGAVSLSVVDPGGAFDASVYNATLAFGYLTPRQRLGVDLIVRANKTYTLSLTSQHQWIMTRTDILNADAVPYTCEVNGALQSVASGTVDLGGASYTSLEGDRYSAVFVIGDFWDLTAGTYSDTITITVGTP